MGESSAAVVSTSSVDVVDGLPATPKGLLDIADAFDRQGYERLARYLRASADVMAVSLGKDDPVATAQVVHASRTGCPRNLIDLTLLVEDGRRDISTALEFPTGARFGLIRLPDLAPAKAPLKSPQSFAKPRDLPLVPSQIDDRL